MRRVAYVFSRLLGKTDLKQTSRQQIWNSQHWNVRTFLSSVGESEGSPCLYCEQEGETSVHQGNISLHIICALTEVQSQCIKLAQTNHCNKCWIGTSVAWKQAYGAHQPVKASPWRTRIVAVPNGQQQQRNPAFCIMFALVFWHPRQFPRLFGW